MDWVAYLVFILLNINIIMIKVFFWNCMGAGSERFQYFFAQDKFTHSPDIVAILEPKISGIQADKAIKLMGFPNSHRVKAQGFRRGI